MAPIFDSPPATPNSFSQPRPRPPRSPGRLAQIRTQNRRRAYLERHEDYFQSTEHELADPILYDSLIRRFQTPSEREAEGRAKGYARVLEGSLLRGEERLARLREQTVDQNGGTANTSISTADGIAAASARPPAATPFGAIPTTTTDGVASTSNGSGTSTTTTTTSRPRATAANHRAATPLNPLPAEMEMDLPTDPTTPPPQTRAEGHARWREFLGGRFIRGEDEDFDYGLVDEDDEYDVLERVEREEAWFEAEDPGWGVVESGEGEGDECGSDEDGEGREGRGRVLRGETGVQDF